MSSGGIDLDPENRAEEPTFIAPERSYLLALAVPMREVVKLVCFGWLVGGWVGWPDLG